MIRRLHFIFTSVAIVDHTSESRAPSRSTRVTQVKQKHTPHTFAVAGDKTMRLLGIHHSKERIVEYVAQDTNAEGYPMQGADK